MPLLTEALTATAETAPVARNTPPSIGKAFFPFPKKYVFLKTDLPYFENNFFFLWDIQGISRRLAMAKRLD